MKYSCVLILLSFLTRLGFSQVNSDYVSAWSLKSSFIDFNLYSYRNIGDRNLVASLGLSSGVVLSNNTLYGVGLQAGTTYCSSFISTPLLFGIRSLNNIIEARVSGGPLFNPRLNIYNSRSNDPRESKVGYDLGADVIYREKFFRKRATLIFIIGYRQLTIPWDGDFCSRTKVDPQDLKNTIRLGIGLGF